jgi:hypothetical protein
MTIMNFNEWTKQQAIITESSGIRTTAIIALTARISGLNRQVQQNRGATQAEQLLSSELLWLSGLVALVAVTGEKGR